MQIEHLEWCERNEGNFLCELERDKRKRKRKVGKWDPSQHIRVYSLDVEDDVSRVCGSVSLLPLSAQIITQKTI